MHKSTKIIPFLLSIFIISGCATETSINRQQSGTMMGALAGGLAASQFGKGEGMILAATAGALIGAYAGNQIGKKLDERDKLLAAKTAQVALETKPSGTSSEWRNPDSGHRGVVIPTKTYKQEDGRYCREFTQEVVIGDKVQKAYGTACRQPDGQWEIVSTN